MYTVYVCDTETTGIDLINCDIIELSLIRFNTGEQKTWHLKPLNPDAIEPDALRVNGHKLEDLLWKTAYGRETYKEPSEVIIDIENWIMNDDMPSEKRIFVAHNVEFDLPRIRRLWDKCSQTDAFPFGRRSVDTMSISFYNDWVQNTLQKGYSLKNLCKKFKVKLENHHTAAADTAATAEVFRHLIDESKNILTNGNKNLISENLNMKNFIEDLKKDSSDINSLLEKYSL